CTTPAIRSSRLTAQNAAFGAVRFRASSGVPERPMPSRSVSSATVWAWTPERGTQSSVRPRTASTSSGSPIRPARRKVGDRVKRRHFLMTSGLAVGATGAATAAQPAGQNSVRPEIRITDIKSFLVGLGRNHVFVKIETDQGIHGIGEAYSCGPDQATV